MTQRDPHPITALDHLDESRLIRAIIDVVPDPIFIRDRTGRFTLSNRAFSEAFGLVPGIEIGKTASEVAELGEHAALVTVGDEELLQNSQAVLNRELQITRAEGTRLDFLASKYPIAGQQGEVIAILSVLRDITLQKTAELNLAKERQMLQTLADVIPDPLFLKDRQGRHILYNKAKGDLFGLAEVDYLGKTVFDLPIPHDHAVKYHEDDERVFTTGIPVINREEPYTAPGKEHGWFLTSKYPLRDAEGNITGLVGICRDISDRREAERKLSDERNFLQTLIDAIPDLIFCKDREGRHLHMNAADRHIFGVSGEHIGKTVRDFPVPPEIAERYERDDRTVLETGEPIFNREEPFVRPDGSTGWLLTTKLPLRNDAGEIIGIVGIARDVTELRREREELEGARQRLVDHVENSPLAVIEWLPDFRVQRWGGRSQDIFGWTQAEVQGRHFFDWAFVHPDDAAEVSATTSRLLSGAEQRNNCKVRNLTKSGETVHSIWHNSVLRDDQGRIVSIFSFVQNFTDQIRAEDQARRADVERRAIERKLLEAQKLESLGLLAGGIAHDFNNLLTSVIGNASLAATEVDERSSIGLCLEQIQLAASRAADLCQQMLAYSGKGRFQVRRIDLNQIITDTTSLIHASISKTASLGLSLAPMLPSILADEAQMRQIVMNLVINASEALSDRSGAIRVSTGLMPVSRAWLLRAHLTPDLAEGEYVFVEVADTGCGMSVDIKSRIFDPFFSTKFTGRGLGLAAVQGIVRGHGGAIRVESEVDRGTTIRAIFPRITGPSESSPPTSSASDRWRSSGRVLVIDDEETVRRVTTRMLESMGFEVVLAVDGQDGLHQFEIMGKEARIVLLDLTMPRLDGEGTYRELHKLNPKTPVILMSGFNEQEVASHFVSHDIAGFLQKPFTLAMLENKLREVLG